NYYYLLGRIEDIQGYTDYKVGDYKAAFKHFRVACQYMALYSRPQYEKFLRKLLDLLLDTPLMYLPEVVDVLTSYWYDLDLDKDYPELLKICKAVSKYLVL